MPSDERRSAANVKSHTLLLGNDNPQMQHSVPVLDDSGNVVVDSDGNVAMRMVSRPAAHLQQSVTTAVLWDGVCDEEFAKLTLSTDNDLILKGIAATLKPSHRRYAVAIHEINQLWDAHSPGARPAWVDGADKALVRAVADYFGCQVGEPKALLTTAGRDKFHDALFTTGTQPAAFNYMAITTDSAAASAGDTTLASEETLNGLGRAQGTYAHTGGTNTSTVTKTFTYTGSGAKVLAKIGIFNAASGVTMGYESLLSSTATVAVSGDSATVTDTATVG